MKQRGALTVHLQMQVLLDRPAEIAVGCAAGVDRARVLRPDRIQLQHVRHPAHVADQRPLVRLVHQLAVLPPAHRRRRVAWLPVDG